MSYVDQCGRVSCGDIRAERDALRADLAVAKGREARLRASCTEMLAECETNKCVDERCQQAACVGHHKLIERARAALTEEKP